MALHAVRNGVAAGDDRLDIDAHEPVHPACGSLSGCGSDAMREVAVGVLEHGSIAEYSIDFIRPVGVVQWIHVDFHGLEQLGWRVGNLPEERLTADDYKFVEPNRIGGSADDMVEVLTAQLPDLREDLAPFGLGQRAGER